MRNARLVGLSPDGRSLIVADDSDEQLELAADDRLRAAVREAGPRPGRESQMTTPLTPRDIQARIRAGESLADVAADADLAYDRVQRFAAPVLAEREHLALLATTSSIRRRGETSGHRPLRATVAERLLKRGVDADTVDWDAYRLEDGRWAVTASYRLAEQEQTATFTFDVRGRFSVPADEAARWLAGEQAAGGPAGRDRAGAAEEPTVDLSDELALVRAVQEPGPAGPAPTEEPPAEPPARALRAVPRPPEPEPEPADERKPGQETSELATLDAVLEPGPEEGAAPAYAGLSDASAVPETAAGGWQPAAAVDFPVEPAPADEQQADEQQADEQQADEQQADEPAGREQQVPPDQTPPEQEEEFQLKAEQPEPRKPAKRKRAAVPSWDEIMFGGPKPPG